MCMPYSMKRQGVLNYGRELLSLSWVPWETFELRWPLEISSSAGFTSDSKCPPPLLGRGQQRLLFPAVTSRVRVASALITQQRK